VADARSPLFTTSASANVVGRHCHTSGAQIATGSTTICSCVAIGGEIHVQTRDEVLKIARTSVFTGPRPAPLDQDPMVRDPIMLAFKSISSITFIKFIILTQELHESPKDRSPGFLTGPMALVDIQLIDVEPMGSPKRTSSDPWPPIDSLPVDNDRVKHLGHTHYTGTLRRLDARVDSAHPYWHQPLLTQAFPQPTWSGIKALNTSMAWLINYRAREGDHGLLLPPKICQATRWTELYSGRAGTGFGPGGTRGGDRRPPDTG